MRASEEDSRKGRLANRIKLRTQEKKRKKKRKIGNGESQLIWLNVESNLQYLEAPPAAEPSAVLPGSPGGEEAPIDLRGHGAVPAGSTPCWLPTDQEPQESLRTVAEKEED